MFPNQMASQILPNDLIDTYETSHAGVRRSHTNVEIQLLPPQQQLQIARSYYTLIEITLSLDADMKFAHASIISARFSSKSDRA